jgi:hypothetical protein
MNIAASGEFWLPETPDETVRGAFRADAGEQPEAVLADALAEDPRGEPHGYRRSHVRPRGGWRCKGIATYNHARPTRLR